MPLFLVADATKLPFADNTFDLVLGSPPYADARTYGIGAQRNALEWVDFMLKVSAEACRVSKGLVLWVAAGVTRKWCYWPCVEGLMWEWFKLGNKLWRPCYWHRVGIPGSGGKQWLRADVEYVVAFTKCTAAVPWADNTANGHPPKWVPGGEMSHRLTDGTKRNQLGHAQGTSVDKEGKERYAPRPSHYEANTPGPSRRADGTMKKVRRCTRGKAGGDAIQEDAYLPPALANPGCLIKGIKVGGGVMGNKLCHENEAPFPENLAKWFIRGWCPPGGIVLDPFSGSGTTIDAAIRLSRRAVGCDLRLSQCQLGNKRCDGVQAELF